MSVEHRPACNDACAADGRSHYLLTGDSMVGATAVPVIIDVVETGDAD